MSEFDPRFNAPKTDEEVEIAIDQYRDPIYKDSVRGIYSVFRAMGHDVSTAWENTLHIALDQKDKVKPLPERTDERGGE